MYVNGNNKIYFGSFRVEHIPKEIQKFIRNKNINRIQVYEYKYRIQVYDSIMYWYFFVGFIGFMLKCQSLLDYTNLFFPNEYEKND